MKTFDQILPEIRHLLDRHRDRLNALGEMGINRDLNGRIRLIVSDKLRHQAEAELILHDIAKDLLTQLEGRAYPIEQAVLFERDIHRVQFDSPWFPLEGFEQIYVIDRLATEGNWSTITPEQPGAPRVVFFSIKGGVGRSSALAATAWSLAQKGQRVLVLDLDLESPGLSTSLLPPERQPAYGITDWLVEDLVDNADSVFDAMLATSNLSHDGEIYVIPAHGADPGEYVSKLGRVWLPKVGPSRGRERWSQRLQRLLTQLEARVKPDLILLDSRAGIDEVASSCITDLGAKLILLFAIEGHQTWNGYRILFNHWRHTSVVEQIRERLQIVSALTPEVDQIHYLEALRDSAYDLFSDTQYDEIPPGETSDGRWNFEATDETAPHAPWTVKWHRSFAGIRSLHGRIAELDNDTVHSLFGPLITGIAPLLTPEHRDV